MAARRNPLSVLLAAGAGACLATWALQTAFVAPPPADSGATALRGSGAGVTAAAAAASALAPEMAQARLPDEFVAFAPIVDVLPILPFFFFLLAFLWQASVGFRWAGRAGEGRCLSGAP